MKYQSLTAATETLKLFFSDHPDSDIVSLQEIYIVAKRDLSKPDKNKSWLGNKLTHLRHYGFVTPVYTQGTRRTLDKIQLTAEGKKVLGRNGQSFTATTTAVTPNTVSLESIAQDIKEFERQNPSIQLNLGVEIKKEVAMSQG